MIRKKFKYYLRINDSLYYTVSAGSVVTTAVKTPITADPMDWRNLDIQWKRSPTLAGVFRSYVLSTSFVRDAAKILRHIYYTQGIEGVCQLEAEQLDTTTQQYLPYYIGDIDFKEAQDSLNFFRVNIMEAGLTAIVNAKRNIPFETPILNADCVNVYMDGITLQALAHYVIPEQGISSPIGLSNSFLIAPSSSEGLNESIQSLVMSQALPASFLLADTTIYETKYTETIRVRVKGTFYALWPGSASNTVFFTIKVTWGVPGGATNTIDLYTAPTSLAPGNDATYYVDVTSTALLMNPADHLNIMIHMVDTGTTFSSTNARLKVFGNDGFVDITSEFQLYPSTVKGYRKYQLFQKHVSAMTGGAYGAVSTYLSNPAYINQDNKPYNTVMACGDAIRGLGNGATADTAAKIVTTLDEIHADSMGRDMCGIGIEGDNVVLERLDHFFQDELLVSLGEVSNLDISVADAYLFNVLKVGYEALSNDELGGSLNGRDEFNCKFTFATEGIRVKQELTLITPYTASIFAEEDIRANLSGKKTTNSSTDNSTFLLEITDNPMPSGSYPLSRKQDPAFGGSASGVMFPDSIFNVGLSPKRCFNRNAPRIATGVHLQQGTTIKFQTADKNSNLIADLGTGSIIEKADVPVNTLPAPLFLPIIFQFETKVPVDVPDLIAANPYGYVEFEWLGTTHKGFIEEVGIKPADNATYTWRLLAHTDTNLNTLIR